MPEFLLTSPEGKKYKVTGPEGSTGEDAVRMLQRKLAGLPDLAPEPKPNAPVTSTGLAKAGGAGLAEGTLGLLGSVGGVGSIGQKLGLMLGEKVSGLLGRDPQETAERRKAMEGALSRPGPLTLGGPGDLQKKAESVTGQFYEPQNKPEQFVRTAASFLPSAAGGPGGLARRAGAAVSGGLASEAAGQATAGTKYEPYARAVAGIAGGFPFGRWRSAAPKPGGPAPLVDELHAAADQQYRDIRAMDLRLHPQPVAKIAGEIANKLGERGFSATNVPETFAVLDRLSKPAAKGAFVGAQDFDNARQELLQATRNAQNLREGPAAWQAIEGMDKYLSSIPAAHVIRGDAKAASRLFDEARGNWAAMKRLEMAGGKVELGKLNADTSHSGMNTDNATRQAVKQLIRPNKYGKTLAEQHGFNEREIDAMNRIARGTAATNTLRYIGNLLGGGGGVGTAALTLGGAGLGYETGHPELAGLGLLGIGARRAGGAMTQSQARRLLEDIARRSPEGRGTPMTPRPSEAGEMLGAGGLRGLSSTYGGPQ